MSIITSGHLYRWDCLRNLTTPQLTEHKRATKKGDLNYITVAEHRLKTSHTIDWDPATYRTD